MTPFIWGIVVGAPIGFAAMFALIATIANRANKRARQAAPKRPSDRERLAIARRYLGQITTRESIKQVRMIAHKALKETGDDK